MKKIEFVKDVLRTISLFIKFLVNAVVFALCIFGIFYCFEIGELNFIFNILYFSLILYFITFVFIEIIDMLHGYSLKRRPIVIDKGRPVDSRKTFRRWRLYKTTKVRRIIRSRKANQRKKGRARR